MGENTKIEVTQQHIDDGMKESCSGCPVALAINELLLESASANVGGTSVAFYTTNDTSALLSFLPQEAANFIREFDCGLPVYPFNFEIEFPSVEEPA